MWSGWRAEVAEDSEAWAGAARSCSGDGEPFFNAETRRRGDYAEEHKNRQKGLHSDGPESLAKRRAEGAEGAESGRECNLAVTEQT